MILPQNANREMQQLRQACRSEAAERSVLLTADGAVLYGLMPRRDNIV
jgi:hypothetical protein